MPLTITPTADAPSAPDPAALPATTRPNSVPPMRGGVLVSKPLAAVNNQSASAKVTKAWSISANKVDGNIGSDTIVAHGAARITIADQNSILFADDITYDRTTGIVDAAGHVSIVRDHNKTTGSRFKFQINSDEYLITQPDVCVGMPKLIARLAQPLQQSIKPPSAVSEIDKFLDDDSEDDMPGLFGGAMKKLLNSGH